MALDSGIFVAGLMRMLPPERHLGAAILQVARKKAFRLVVLESVVRELSAIAERENSLDRFEAQFLDLLSECDVEWQSPPPIPNGKKHGAILRRLRHLNDLQIALELEVTAPDYFIHSNPEHWTSELDDLLNTSVMTPREFLISHDIKPPAPLKR